MNIWVEEYDKWECLSPVSQTRLLEGMYPIFMVDWLRIFPREQMFIMRYEDYAIDVKGKMRQLFEFLDLGRSLKLL